MAVAFLCVGN